MKKIALFFLYVTLFFMALLFFTPKENLYYYAEEQLKPLGVVVGYEEVRDRGFSLEIQHAKLFVKKIKAANIESLVLKPYFLYNSLHVEKIILDKTFEQFFPPLIERIDVTQSVIKPLQLQAEAIGDFGEATANVNLLDRNVSVVLKPSKIMLSRYKNTLRQLKKSKEGTYRYESQF